MSHRHRSQCCCGDPIVPQDCFLGYGTVPPPVTDGFQPTQDRCGFWPSPYESAKDSSPYHHWSFCNASLNEELILTLERDVSIDRFSNFAYQYSLNNPAGSAQECLDFFNRTFGLDCTDCASCCSLVSQLVGNPESGSVSKPNDPLYVRYKRLKNIPASDPKYVDWSSSLQDVENRPYIWRTISSLIDGPGWDERLNGGHPLWPLFLNPWEAACDPNPTVDDLDRPHGTAVQSESNTFYNCQEWDSGVGRCKDWSCSVFGGGNQFDCDQEYRGLSGKFLTPAQSQLIGKNWDTNEYGYVSTTGYVRGDNCFPGEDTCSGDPPDDYYINSIYEQGSAYFWLQGIADHNMYETQTTNEARYYKHYAYRPSIGVVPIFKGYGGPPTCENQTSGLYPLAETLAGVFHRETWWEKYWNGYRRDAYENLNPNNVPPDSYFTHNNDSLVSEYTPEFINMQCSGIPVFTWELHDLYRVDGGNPPIVSDEDIKNYHIPAGVLQRIKAAFPEVDTNNFIYADPNDSAGIREDHLLSIFICLFYELELPYQVTDLLQDYGVLPAPTNYGEEQNYKIFKKKIRYYIPDAPEPVGEGTCCINTGQDIQIGNCGIAAADRTGPVCEAYPEYCESTFGCIWSPCEQVMCESFDSFCCDVAWDETCVEQALAFPECLSESFCLTTDEITCRFILGGQFGGIGITCPSGGSFIYDHLNQTFCDGDQGNVLGSCCNNNENTCNETTQANCPNAFYLHTNCEGNNAICNCDPPSSFCAAPGVDSNGDPIEICEQWGARLEDDFYFYGRPGGWNYLNSDARGAIQSAPLSFPSGLSTLRNRSGWNPWPYPIEMESFASDPLNDPDPNDPIATTINSLCCAEGTSPPCFGQAVGTDCATILADIEDPDNDPSTPIIPLTCSNYSASITCRGVWFQWNINDHGPGFPATTVPSIGCDSMSNSFWLRQDPYQIGQTKTIGITVNSEGITASTINGVQNNTFTLKRGEINKIDYSSVIDSYETFKSEDFEENGILYESTGFEILIGSISPDNTDDGLISGIYGFMERVNYETSNDIIEFNPFEQLDENEYTKSPGTVYWQIQEVFRYLPDPDDPDGYENFYRPLYDLDGTISIIDKQDSTYTCTEEPRIKYSGKAARLYEYQWYHPPYIVTTGDSAVRYINVFGENCLFGPEFPESNSGQCCNTRMWPITDTCSPPYNIGRKAGPAGSSIIPLDDSLPPAP